MVIIGGGPGGLACARELAGHGKQVVLLERKPVIGPKVCAGGITWSGLLQHVPPALIERSFPVQHIYTQLQHIQVTEPQPIIATISRRKTGQWMAERARTAGAEIFTSSRVRHVSDKVVTVRRGAEQITIGYGHLVGADGANSLVRRFLQLPSTRMGIGLNCTLPLRRQEMEWHLLPGLFGSGYAWIFPHQETISIGAYVDKSEISVKKLKQNLVTWAAARGVVVPEDRIRAGLVNYDYRGYAFDNCWLVGEAAGLVSGLTGEGIYPAIVSGQAVARKILDPDYPAAEVEQMVRKQQRHHRVIDLAQRAPVLCGLLMNLLVLLLRWKLLDFRMLEMAD